MEKEPKPQNLTTGVFSELYLSNKNPDVQAGFKLSGVFQVLDIKDDNTRISISDGHYYVDCLLFKSCKPKISENGILKHDVISATMVIHKGKLFVVIDLMPVYKGVNQLIGNPVKVEDFESVKPNPNGETKIPQRIVAPMEKEKRASSSANERREVAGSNFGDDDFTPISMLTVGSNSWMIKGRVLTKSDLRNYGGKDPSKKPGVLFNIVITDKTGKVQATFFNEAANKFHSFLKEGEVYTFSGAEVKKRSQFNSTNSSVELSFGVRADIQQASDDGKIAKESFDFIKLKEVAVRDNNTVCDVVALIKEVGQPMDVNLRSGEVKQRRNVTILDDSMTEVEVTFWGDTFPILNTLKKNDVVVMTGLKINEFKGRNLAAGFETKITTKIPDHKIVREVIVFRNNMMKAGSGMKDFQSLKTSNEYKEMNIMTIANIKKLADSVIHQSDDTDNKFYFMFAGYITMLPGGSNDFEEKKTMASGNFYYNKCPNETCWKKVHIDGDTIECNSCGISKKQPVPKFIGTCRFHDTSDSIYCKFSSDYAGLSLYGKSAKDLKDMETLEPSRESIQKLIKSRYNTLYYVKITPKKDVYNGETKTGYNIITAQPLNPKTASLNCKSLIHTIKNLQLQMELS